MSQRFRTLLTLPECPAPGLERATRQLKELRQEVHVLRILGGTQFGRQNSAVTVADI